MTARESGESVEVDYAGDTFAWLDLRTGEVHKASVLLAGRGFSQLLFAWASEGMKRRSTRPVVLEALVPGRCCVDRDSMLGCIGTNGVSGLIDNFHQ